MAIPCPDTQPQPAAEETFEERRLRIRAIRQQLDAAVEAALPVAGGRVLKRLRALRAELARVDAEQDGRLRADPATGSVIMPEHW